jgi:hypothetical protein
MRRDSHARHAPTTTRAAAPTNHHMDGDVDGVVSKEGMGVFESLSIFQIHTNFVTAHRTRFFHRTMAHLVKLNAACKSYMTRSASIADKKREIKELSSPLREDTATILDLMTSAGLPSCTSGDLEFHRKESVKKPVVSAKVILQLLGEFLNDDDRFQAFTSRLAQYRESNASTHTSLAVKKRKDAPMTLGGLAGAVDASDAAADALDDLFP